MFGLDVKSMIHKTHRLGSKIFNFSSNSLQLEKDILSTLCPGPRARLFSATCLDFTLSLSVLLTVYFVEYISVIMDDIDAPTQTTGTENSNDSESDVYLRNSGELNSSDIIKNQTISEGDDVAECEDYTVFGYPGETAPADFGVKEIAAIVKLFQNCGITCCMMEAGKDDLEDGGLPVWKSSGKAKAITSSMNRHFGVSPRSELWKNE